MIWVYITYLIFIPLFKISNFFVNDAMSDHRPGLEPSPLYLEFSFMCVATYLRK